MKQTHSCLMLWLNVHVFGGTELLINDKLIIIILPVRALSRIIVSRNNWNINNKYLGKIDEEFDLEPERITDNGLGFRFLLSSLL